MGIYINPVLGLSKLGFLSKWGTNVRQDEFLDLTGALSRQMFPCVWVDNGAFAAVAIADSAQEALRFIGGVGDRPHAYYWVRWEGIRTEGGVPPSLLRHLAKVGGFEL